jgi:hypothetical protein
MAIVSKLALELAWTSNALQETFSELNITREELQKANARANELHCLLQQTIYISKDTEARMAISETECNKAKEELELYKLFVASYAQSNTETKNPELPTSDTPEEYFP